MRVTELEPSIDFYRVLGAEPITPACTLGARTVEFAMNTRRAVSARVVLLRFPDGSGLELFEFGDPEPEWSPGAPDPAARLPHLAVRVPDVDATLVRLEDAGGHRLWNRPRQWGSARVVYVADPDGNVAELVDASLAAVAAGFVA